MKLFSHIVLGLLILLLPLFFWPYSSNPFITGKIFFVFVLLALALIIKAIESIISKKNSFFIGEFDLPIALIAISFLTSTFFRSPNFMEAIVLPGPTSIIILGALTYFLINQLDLKWKKIVSYLFVASSFLTSIIILLSVTGVIKMGANFNPTGDFLTSSIFLFITIPFTISLVFREPEFLGKFLIGAAGAMTALTLALSIYLILPGKPLSPHILPLNISAKIYTESFKESPIIGIGPGNYLTAFNKYRTADFNLTSYWNENFNSGTNFIFTLGTETGTLGLGIILFLIYKIIKVSLKKIKERKLVGWGFLVSLDLISIFLLILIFFIFPISIVNLITFFILLGIMSDHTKEISFNWILALILLIPIVYGSYKVILSDYKFSKALVAASKNNPSDTYKHAKEAISLNPKVDRYHIFLSRINFLLAASLAQKENLKDEERKQIALFVQGAIDEAKAAVSTNNQRSENWEHLGKTYQSMIEFADGSDQFAIESYKQAIALDPTNPNLRIALGDVFYLTKDYMNAIENYKLATYAKSDLANAHYNLALAHKANGEIEKARVEFDITLDLTDPKSNDYKIVQNEIASLNKKAVETPVETTPEDLTSPVESGL